VRYVLFLKRPTLDGSTTRVGHRGEDKKNVKVAGLHCKKGSFAQENPTRARGGLGTRSSRGGHPAKKKKNSC